MSRMPNIDLDLRSLNQMFMNRLSAGGEAVICRSFKPNTLFKIFADAKCQAHSDSFGVPLRPDLIQMSDNKLKKIAELYQRELLFSVRPLSTISMDGRLIGYEMSYDPEDKPLSSQSLSREELICFLSQGKDILEYYAGNDITYGDVSEHNFLVNLRTGAAKFCDMDNIRLGQYPIDIMGRNLNIYNIIRGIDSSADAYMHNIMTLTRFDKTGKLSYFDPPSRLVQKDFSEDFADEARAVLDSMIEPGNFNGEYVIPYVKKKI